jgi:hypothetical protein
MNRRLVGVAVVVGILALASQPARAETDPRDYEALVQLPTRTAVLIAYYRHQSSTDDSLTQNLAIFRAVYTLKFGDLSIVPFDFLLPVADVSLNVPTSAASQITLTGSGIGDLQYLPTIQYTMHHAEHNYTYIGFTPYISFPTGNFDGARPINIGNNRFSIEPEIGIGQRYAMFDLELNFNATIYGDSNDHIIPAGAGTANATLSQDATKSFVAHLSMDLNPLTWIAVSYYITANGAQHYVGTGFDVIGTPEQTVNNMRFTWAFRLEKATLLTLQYNQDIHSSGGASLNRFWGARISTFF